MTPLVRRVVMSAVCILAACATVPPEAPQPGGFSIVGRVAVRYGEDASNGRITWRHSAENDDLVISTPLGQGVAEITRRDGVYTLLTSNERRYTAADPEQLTEQVLGWALPLSGLTDWIQGRPQQGVKASTRYDGDRLVELGQLGWMIEYSAYEESNRLPKRMRLKRGELDIRLVIDEWQVTPR